MGYRWNFRSFSVTQRTLMVGFQIHSNSRNMLAVPSLFGQSTTALLEFANAIVNGPKLAESTLANRELRNFDESFDKGQHSRESRARYFGLGPKLS